MQIANQYIFERLLQSQIINQPYVMLNILMMTVSKPQSHGVFIHPLASVCVFQSYTHNKTDVLVQKED